MATQPPQQPPQQPTSPASGEPFTAALLNLTGGTAQDANQPAPKCETEGCSNPREGVIITPAVPAQPAEPATDTTPEKPATPEIPARIAYLSRCCESCVQAIRRREEEEENEKIRAARRARHWQWWVDQWGGPKSAYLTTDFAKLPNQAAAAEVLKWEPEDGHGLILTGITGRGKTRSVYLLLHRILFERGIKPEIWKCIHLRHAVANAARSDDLKARDRLMEKIKGAPIVYLDDLGQMANTPAAEETLMDLVEELTVQGTPIIATSQFSGERFMQSFKRPETGQAITRRLEDFCKPIAF